MFSHAIVRFPSRNFAGGLTSSGLPSPDYALAMEQHDAYCQALERIGITVIRLPADERYPDSTFVEDTAVVTNRGAVLARPGAPSRQGEVEDIKHALAQFYSDVQKINALGTLDGGDVCQVEDHFFIGVSERTNEEGAAELANMLNMSGYSSTLIDIRSLKPHLLHLKSGLAYLGDNRLAVNEALLTSDKFGKQFRKFEVIRLESGEEYAANCLAFDGTILVAAGYPRFESELRRFGYRTIALDMSEFQKMDGGLSCLSLRF